jgi:hypothetical protein
MGNKAMLLLVGGCAVGDVAPPHLSDVSRVLYLNDCLPVGCIIDPGTDDARTNHSSIVTQRVRIDAFSWGASEWYQLTSCVQRMYAPFDLVITDVDPGEAPHFELVVGGLPASVGLGPSAGGAAVRECPNALEDNNVGFVFAQRTPDVETMCWAAAQEAGHMFGLDHELDPEDPMSWVGDATKPGFQDQESACGEYSERWCDCDRQTQNSYQTLLATLGPAKLLY